MELMQNLPKDCTGCWDSQPFCYPRLRLEENSGTKRRSSQTALQNAWVYKLFTRLRFDYILALFRRLGYDVK